MASVKLSEEQQHLVRAWAEAGADLNQIQDRLKTEQGITLTFMETRFLLADLAITLQAPQEDVEPTPATEEEELPDFRSLSEDAAATEPDAAFDDLPPAGDGNVTLTVDEITLPGSLASGKVTFSDGKTASWYLDQLGRLGLTGIERTYQPTEADAIAFQRELQNALRRAGY